MKTCSRCKAEKPDGDFYIDRRRNKPLSVCKPCGVEKAREYRHRNPDFEIRRYAREKAAVRERHLIRKYGITQARYDEMFSAQSGCCAICGKSQDRNFDVDHNHTTGEVRGLLCTNCNRMIGHAGDNPQRLINAALYLGIIPQVAAEFISAYMECLS